MAVGLQFFLFKPTVLSYTSFKQKPINFFPILMAIQQILFVFFSSITIFMVLSNAQPSPGYYPSSKIKTVAFSQVYTNQWGPQHQRLENHNSLTIWLDKSSGSGFKSKRAYRSGYFGAGIKLHPGYTAGVITSLYLSNGEAHPGFHDEVDIEFLGTTPGKPYILQTNVYIRGSGDGNIIGREMKYHLWFDPSASFHNYAIYWSSNEIIFLVDDVPIRRYKRKSDATFPLRPMWVYGSIWDASSWATEGGKYKSDYSYQPFVGRYTNFKLDGCSQNEPVSCRRASVSPYPSDGLSTQQNLALQWVQKNYLVYDYCKDSNRDSSPIPECWMGLDSLAMDHCIFYPSLVCHMKIYTDFEVFGFVVMVGQIWKLGYT